MFDTIKIRAENIDLDERIIHKFISNKKDVVRYIDTDTGEHVSKYTFKTDYIPYMIYYSSSKSLTMQVSIPKFLYGENITLINKADIKKFWEQLEKHLYNCLEVIINKQEWILTRIDVCWNFNVGSKVNHYIQKLGLMKFPYKDTYYINHGETVVFKNKTSKIMFYDKEKECIVHKQNENTILKAKGILRLEITPSYRDLKKFSLKRKAVRVLSSEFFFKITQPILDRITIPSDESDITYEWLKDQNVSKIETAIGYTEIFNAIGESNVKNLYGANYYKRRNLINEVTLPEKNKLFQLKINSQSIC